MKRLNYLIGLSILVAFILAMVAIVPASADKPERYRFPNGGEGTVTVCGPEFTWYQEFVQQGKNSCDPDTGLCEFNDHIVSETFTITNPDNGRKLVFHGGEHARGTQISTSEWTDEWIYEITGDRFKGTIPGVGPVFGSPGRDVIHSTCTYDFDIEEWVCVDEYLFSSGKDFFDIDAICNYLLDE